MGLAVACLLSPGNASAAVQVGVEASGGTDSNPLALSAPAGDARFGRVRFWGGLQVPAGEHWSVAMSLSGVEERFERSSRNADTRRLSADLAVEVRSSSRRPRWTGSFRVFRDRWRGTFVDRVTGEPATLPLDPQNPSAGERSLGQRLDHDASGVDARLRLRAGRRWRLDLKAESLRFDYVEDYRDLPGLESLDHRRESLEPGVWFEVRPDLVLGISHRWSRWIYDEQPALDGSGAPAGEATRRYSNRDLRVRVVARPLRGSRLRLGWTGLDRRDVWADYYSHHGAIRYAVWTLPLGAGLEGRVWASRSRVDYENAVAGAALNGETRSYRADRYGVEVRRGLPAGCEWFVAGAWTDSLSADPLYTYERLRAWTGVQWEWTQDRGKEGATP